MRLRGDLVIFIIELGLCFAFHIAGYSKAKQLLRSSRSIYYSVNDGNDRMKKKTAVRYVFKRRRHQQLQKLQQQRGPAQEIEMKTLNHVPSAEVDGNKT